MAMYAILILVSLTPIDDRLLKARHSSHCQESSKTSTNSFVYSESDLNVVCMRRRAPESLGSQGEYYKRYEHDEVPVKDSIDNSFSKPSKGSLTNSDLERLETRIFQNVSQELQTDEGSLSSLESNIKFFKTTVEKIFENFYTSMSDFEHYKSRFHAILDRSKDGSIDDMEEFIKDMFEHIMSSDNSASNIIRLSHKSTDQTIEVEPQETETITSSVSSYTEPHLSAAVLESYKNDHYLTDSTFDESPHAKSCKIEEIFNIFLGGNPCVQIKMHNRNLLSEINIRETKEKVNTGSIASADNLTKLAAKRMEVERYVRQQDHNLPDREIPVKVSYAKKNIYLNEDFARNDCSDTPRSLISKICNILCKKFRKSSFG